MFVSPSVSLGWVFGNTKIFSYEKMRQFIFHTIWINVYVIWSLCKKWNDISNNLNQIFGVLQLDQLVSRYNSNFFIRQRSWNWIKKNVRDKDGYMRSQNGNLLWANSLGTCLIVTDSQSMDHIRVHLNNFSIMENNKDSVLFIPHVVFIIKALLNISKLTNNNSLVVEFTNSWLCLRTITGTVLL